MSKKVEQNQQPTDDKREAAEFRPVSWLKPMPKNPRKHPAGQVERIAESITRYGWGRPVLALPDGTIIAGHGSVEAAKLLGMTQVPVRVMPLTRQAATELAAVDNALTDQSSFDDALLAEIAEAGDDALREILGHSAAEEHEPEVEELDVSKADADFWLVVRGPLASMPDVLLALTSHLKTIEGVEVECNAT